MFPNVICFNVSNVSVENSSINTVGLKYVIDSDLLKKIIFVCYGQLFFILAVVEEDTVFLFL